jgi:hypothetical protein
MDCRKTTSAVGSTDGSGVERKELRGRTGAAGDAPYQRRRIGCAGAEGFVTKRAVPVLQTEWRAKTTAT